jgi:ubiquinone/menaquinone biosynthesis C-methylase UbiE
MMKSKPPFFSKLLYQGYVWLTERLYHQLAWAYDTIAWLVSFGQWSEWRLVVLGHLLPGQILEVGFGTGELLFAMVEQGLDVTGLEISGQMHQIVSRKFRRKGCCVNRVQSRVETMPFSPQVFDNVISTFPSGYILREETLQETYRVLKSNGRMIVLGLYVVLKPGLLRWLTRWYLGSGGVSFIEHFVASAKQVGFEVEVIMHDTKRYILPVVILERNND